MSYLSFTFSDINIDQREILFAYLDAIGFEGFEEDDDRLIAFIPSDKFSEEIFKATLDILSIPVSYHKNEFHPRNWNETWEKQFQPVIIADQVGVRASFHPSMSHLPHEIIIDPKMSFGTGHHATTSMMMQLMLNENFHHKSVLDFGCGTGILSILASKLGAKSVVAIDNDERAIENARENLVLNGAENVSLIKDNSPSIEGNQFDIILANINRDVILKNAEKLVRMLSQPGKLIISGFLAEDIQQIVSETGHLELKLEAQLQELEWCAVVFNN